MTRELENIVESIIFASPEGASTKEITRCVRSAVATAREKDGEMALEAITRFAEVDESRVTSAIAHLNAIYEETGRAFMLVERPAGWRIMSRVEFSPWVRELFPDKKPARLTPSALETLAIIAYRQPMTKSSIEAVRGVSIDGPLQALLDRNVVRIAGRADLPGRPLLYETTDLFLEHFGIRTVDELPNASELRSVKLPEPEPVTVPEAAPQAELPLEGAEGEAPEAKPKKKGRKKEKNPSADEAAGSAAVETAIVTEAGSADGAPGQESGESLRDADAPDAEWSPPDEPDEPAAAGEADAAEIPDAPEPENPSAATTTAEVEDPVSEDGIR